MSLLSTMKELPKENKVDITATLGDSEEMQERINKTVEGFEPQEEEEPRKKRKTLHLKKEEEEKKPKVEEVEEPEEEDDGEEEKPEVSAYKQRKIKDIEKQLADEREERKRERERADRLEAAALANNRQPEPKREERRQPDPKVDPDGYVQYMLEEGVNVGKTAQQAATDLQKELTRIRAKEELREMEDDFSAKRPDYKKALKFTMDRDFAIQKRMYPNASDREIRNHLEMQHMMQISRFQNAGIADPLEIDYQNMLTYGWKPDANDAEDDQDEVDEVKNLKSVVKNKAKSATSLTAGGRGAKDASSESPRMSLTKFSKLSKAEKDQIYRNKRQG